jgi:hypothetical protein
MFSRSGVSGGSSFTLEKEIVSPLSIFVAAHGNCAVGLAVSGGGGNPGRDQ